MPLCVKSLPPVCRATELNPQSGFVVLLQSKLCLLPVCHRAKPHFPFLFFHLCLCIYKRISSTRPFIEDIADISGLHLLLWLLHFTKSLPWSCVTVVLVCHACVFLLLCGSLLRFTCFTVWRLCCSCVSPITIPLLVIRLSWFSLVCDSAFLHFCWCLWNHLLSGLPLQISIFFLIQSFRILSTLKWQGCTFDWWVSLNSIYFIFLKFFLGVFFCRYNLACFWIYYSTFLRFAKCTICSMSVH